MTTRPKSIIFPRITAQTAVASGPSVRPLWRKIPSVDRGGTGTAQAKVPGERAGLPPDRDVGSMGFRQSPRHQKGSAENTANLHRATAEGCRFWRSRDQPRRGSSREGALFLKDARTGGGRVSMRGFGQKAVEDAKSKPGFHSIGREHDLPPSGPSRNLQRKTTSFGLQPQRPSSLRNHLPPHQILVVLPLPDQVHLPRIHHNLRRPRPGVVVRRHGEPVGPRDSHGKELPGPGYCVALPLTW